MGRTLVVQHQPWSRDHDTEDDNPEEGGWCHHTVLSVPDEDGRQRMGVSVQPRLLDEAAPAIDRSVNDDKPSADEPRQMAAGLLRPADTLEVFQGC